MADTVLEIRTYRLKAGGGEAFHQIVAERSVPLLYRWDRCRPVRALRAE
jgi:hypothetical protein